MTWDPCEYHVLSQGIALCPWASQPFAGHCCLSPQRAAHPSALCPSSRYFCLSLEASPALQMSLLIPGCLPRDSTACTQGLLSDVDDSCQGLRTNPFFREPQHSPEHYCLILDNRLPPGLLPVPSKVPWHTSGYCCCLLATTACLATTLS